MIKTIGRQIWSESHPKVKFSLEIFTSEQEHVTVVKFEFFFEFSSEVPVWSEPSERT